MSRPGASIDAAFSGRLGTFSLDVAFSAPMQGITALFGPSGSGKTTVLRCIAGLQRLGGHLRIGDETWQDAAGVFRKTHERPIGYVFQEASLFPHLSVRRNLDYGARRSGGLDAPDGLSFDEIVDLLGIAPLLDRAPAALSGGERQRVAVGRALLSHPRLLLMDEPLAALDRATKEEILPYLEALHENLSIPIFYVSHDIAEVAWLADRIVVLAGGRKLADGPVGDILERLDLDPGDAEFEAGVVLTARVAAHDEAFQATRLDHHGQTITVPIVPIAVGEQVRLRIRARDVILATERPERISVRNILSGTIAGLAEEPDTPFAETLVDIGGARLRARITREAAADLGLAPGTPVFALVKSVALDHGSLALAAGPEHPAG